MIKIKDVDEALEYVNFELENWNGIYNGSTGQEYHNRNLILVKKVCESLKRRLKKKNNADVNLEEKK